jgi:hypothetical protein
MKRNSPLIFTPEMDNLLIELYPDTPNATITELTGWGVEVLKYNTKRLDIRKTRKCKAWMANATEWTEERNQFLRENFDTMTNKQLAAALDLRLTVVRNQTRALGLRKLELEPWTDDQLEFLLANYQVIGDVDIVEILQQRYPRKKGWSKHHIAKKRGYLNLNRTQEQLDTIISKHSKPGGRSYTILKNSGAVTLNDKSVATYLATGAGHKVNQELKKELLNHPDLLQVKRMQLKLDRAMKEVSNAS